MAKAASICMYVCKLLDDGCVFGKSGTKRTHAAAAAFTQRERELGKVRINSSRQTDMQNERKSAERFSIVHTYIHTYIHTRRV